MRSLPDPGFPGDDGVVPPDVAAALARYAEDPNGQYAPALAAIRTARLLVPVVATVGETDHDERGLVRDRAADMATVLLRGRDGRLALLAFTGTEALRRWNPQARPVPVTTRQAAQAALDDGAGALLVDLAGPVTLVVEGDHLDSLARGFDIVRAGDRWVWARVSEGGGAPDR